MIPFNKPIFLGKEISHIIQAIDNGRLCGDGEYNKRCKKWFEEKTGTAEALMTTSCTHALEMAAILLDIQTGDEVIMPSYTFVSTANAFVLRGAKIVFVDIRPDTMNIDETLIEAAITPKTKAIVPVHYAGVGCEMEEILRIARKYNIAVVEDAAQGVLAEYKGQPLGSIGDIGAYSFHETKNYHCGEGGLILLNNSIYKERAEIIREKGTDRSRFFRGEVDKYSWVDLGSSYLPSELNAAYLYAQLERAEEINTKRLKIWQMYREGLKDWVDMGRIEWQDIPAYCKHNAHMFYIKLDDLEDRTKFSEYMKKTGILTIFHYVPLHSAKAGKRFGRFSGEDVYTTRESDRLVRFPMFFDLQRDEVEHAIEVAKKYFKHRG